MVLCLVGLVGTLSVGFGLNVLPQMKTLSGDDRVVAAEFLMPRLSSWTVPGCLLIVALLAGMACSWHALRCYFARSVWIYATLPVALGLGVTSGCSGSWLLADVFAVLKADLAGTGIGWIGAGMGGLGLSATIMIGTALSACAIPRPVSVEDVESRLERRRRLLYLGGVGLAAGALAPRKPSGKMSGDKTATAL